MQKKSTSFLFLIADGIGKNIAYGKEVLTQNGAVVEDALRIKLGKVDWLFVMAGGGGGTGSSVVALQPVFERYLQSVQASGKVVYIVSWPTAQENSKPNHRQERPIATQRCHALPTHRSR